VDKKQKEKSGVVTKEVKTHSIDTSDTKKAPVLVSEKAGREEEGKMD
jgi:hypothetical protein